MSEALEHRLRKNLFYCRSTKIASVYDKLKRRNRIIRDCDPLKVAELTKAGYLLSDVPADEHPKSMGLAYFSNLYAKKFDKFDQRHILCNLTELDEQYGILGLNQDSVVAQSKEIFDRNKVSYGKFAITIDFAKPHTAICVGGRFWTGDLCRPHYHIYNKGYGQTSVCLGDIGSLVSRAITENFDCVEYMNIIDDMLQTTKYVLASLYRKCKICDDIIPFADRKGKVNCDECS